MLGPDGAEGLGLSILVVPGLMSPRSGTKVGTCMSTYNVPRYASVTPESLHVRGIDRQGEGLCEGDVVLGPNSSVAGTRQGEGHHCGDRQGPRTGRPGQEGAAAARSAMAFETLQNSLGHQRSAATR